MILQTFFMKRYPVIISIIFSSTILFAQKPLKGNAGEIILTPPLEMGYTLGGYGDRMNKPAEGIHDDIRAKALVLSDGEKKFAIVTMDILGLPPNVKPAVVKKLADKGWRMENMLFLPSHAHTSLEMMALNDRNIFNIPNIGIFQPELLDFVINKLTELIEATDRDLKPVKAGTGQVTLKDINHNRRDDKFVDRELTVTRIDHADGRPMAVLVNWTAHPTIMGAEDMWVSAGWPGYMQRDLAAWIGDGAIVMYYNGAEGDQSINFHGGESHYERAENYGRTIAIQAKKVYENINTISDPIFAWTYSTIELPPRQPHPTFMETGGTEYGLDEQKIKMFLEQVLPATTHTIAFRLDDLIIVGAPGEMIAELGLDIKTGLKKEGIQYPVIGGLADEWVSYILTEKEYHEGGYETSVSFYGPALGKTVKNPMLKNTLKLIE